jgi:cytochrome c-type biogenesis protein CcmE
MKKTHIFAIVIIAVAIALLIATAKDTSTYVNFNQAYQMSSTGNTGKIHVVGELKKNGSGSIEGLEKSEDHLSFSFVLVDDQHREQKVFYNEPMPPDFLRSEKVVVVGSYQGENFVASKILLKCPSKYQDQKLKAGI